MNAIPDALLPHLPEVFFRQRPDFSFDHLGANVGPLTGAAAEEWKRAPGLFWQAVHELDAEPLRKHLAECARQPDGLATTFRLRHRKTGRVVWISEFRRALFDAGGHCAGYEGFWNDVTRQTVAERRLAAAAWKETLAPITLGFAHDLNNWFTGILSLSDLSLAQIDAGHPLHEGLSLIKKTTLQASQLVQRLGQLHHAKTGARSYHDLNALTSDTVDLLRRVVPRRVELSLQPHSEALPLFADAVEFQRVVIGLALNAAEAVPDRGTLVFQTSLHQELPALAFVQGVLPRLPATCLSLIDDGGGIKAEDIAAIFDPTFSTKPANQGCGLGLDRAKLFIERHHGAISVESVPGKGTTLRLWLPQADFTEAGREEELARQRPRHILVVGEPGPALEKAAAALHQKGYRVIAVSRNAVELLWEHPFDALLVQAGPDESGPFPVLDFARRHRHPAKTIVQRLGVREDETEADFSAPADLVLRGDRPGELDRIDGLFS